MWCCLDDLLLQRPERVEPDVERHALDVELREELRREVQPGGRRGGRAALARIDRLVALRVAERLGDVRRQRHVTVRLALRAARASVPRPDARAARPRRGGRRHAACRVGRASASQTSPSTCSSSSTSPRGRSIGMRAGTTRVSFTTASASTRPGSSRNTWCDTSPVARR